MIRNVYTEDAMQIYVYFIIYIDPSYPFDFLLIKGDFPLYTPRSFEDKDFYVLN